MLCLTFQIGADQFALDIRQVREVVPRVWLHRPAGAPPWLAGTFVYRGHAVPVLDLHRLLGAGECPPHLSSRIILTPWPGAEDVALLGLLAAQVADLREISGRSEVAPALAGGGGALGPAVVEGGAVVHLVDLARLLPEGARDPFTALPGPGGGA